jgi:WD40 repeat protein
MKWYSYDEPTDHHLADDIACVCVLYNPVFYTFVTAHPKCIKIWDATDGTLQSVFRDVSKKEITCMCTDQRHRKLFVGDQGGRVYCLNIKNGAKMKKFAKPEKNFDKEVEYISSIIYWGNSSEGEEGQRNLLLTASWDTK